MEREDEPPLGQLASEGMEKSRLEMLTDGILAVAMTILVLDIKVPPDDSILTEAHLIRHLLEVERTFTIYLISFIVLGMYWISHTLQFHYVRRVDRTMLWLSLLFSLLVTLVPFTTNLLISYETLLVPIVIYGVNLCLLATTLIVNLNYLARNPHLANASLTPAVVAYVQRRLVVFGLVPLLAIALAFINTRLSLYTYSLMLLIHFFPLHIDRTMHRWFRRKGR
jgi:uncharacterized membrane protein